MFSSFLLVFGMQPDPGLNILLDNVPALDYYTPTSKLLADHKNTILAVRKNFNQALTDQRIAKALLNRFTTREMVTTNGLVQPQSLEGGLLD